MKIIRDMLVSILFFDSVDVSAKEAHLFTWVNQGVRIIGSCCGMGPEYTYELKRRFG